MKSSFLYLILDCLKKIISLSGYKTLIKAPTKSESAEVLIFAMIPDAVNKIIKRACKFSFLT